MVSRLALEKLSNRLYRMFSPDTPFLHLQVNKPHYIPEDLPRLEIPGLRFKGPIPAMRGIAIEAWQL